MQNIPLRSACTEQNPRGASLLKGLVSVCGVKHQVYAGPALTAIKPAYKRSAGLHAYLYYLHSCLSDVPFTNVIYPMEIYKPQCSAQCNGPVYAIVVVQYQSKVGTQWFY